MDDSRALRDELDAARREVRRLQDRVSKQQSDPRAGASGGGGGSAGDSAAEARKLREENSKLREELSAFDLDFFEEIEDLKFKYAEAMRRLQQYE